MPATGLGAGDVRDKTPPVEPENEQPGRHTVCWCSKYKKEREMDSRLELQGRVFAISNRAAGREAC